MLVDFCPSFCVIEPVKQIKCVSVCLEKGKTSNLKDSASGFWLFFVIYWYLLFHNVGYSKNKIFSIGLIGFWVGGWVCGYVGFTMKSTQAVLQCNG